MAGGRPRNTWGHTPSGRKYQLPPDWARRRAAVLQRDRHTCYLCGHSTPPADRVDHIKPGNDHSMRNLAAVHDTAWPHCHRYKTANEATKAKQTKQTRNKKRKTYQHPNKQQ